MTISQLKELSNEELRVRVATALGWTKVGPKGFGSNDLVGCKTDPGWPFTHVPRFSESLDAISEAEKTLSDEEWDVYRVRVVELAFVSGRPTWRAMMQANARDRSIAFLAVRQSLG